MGCAALLFREVAEKPYHTFHLRTGTPRAANAVADDPADPDVIENLGDEIATLSAHIHAATHRLLVLIAEFDRLRGWELAGFSNCARWLAARTGIDLGAARLQSVLLPPVRPPAHEERGILDPPHPLVIVGETAKGSDLDGARHLVIDVVHRD